MVTSFPFPQARSFEAYGSDYHWIESFEKWFEKNYSQEENKLFVVTGSLHFISYVREIFREK